MSRAVVLEEIALIPHDDGRFWLYIGHPSRLQHVIDEGAATRRFPASFVSALEAARQRHAEWDGEMETIFDARWREALEPPQRILFSANGSIEHIEEVFGVTWEKLRAALRVRSRENHAGDMGTIEPGARAAAAAPRVSPISDASLEGSRDDRVSHFVQAFHNAESWVRLGDRLVRSMATTNAAHHAG
jgi:hypothetical protein